ncbi:MAG TPA: polymer-forming cytoskeletal protein [Candidatus Aminicenantes bacterium]|nr:polymer-forming cytoskeletal protein [Candidatus Aminicenantes bacterium]HRY66360.1 polymer-forming cytoskeletal protein [Candidatus Aminicenantes bacterium]HRZ73288.1 polymer-forming cytoskeletal protein [Candidatus Aminicenantes bacterium]
MADESVRTQASGPGLTRLGSTVVLTGDIEAHEDMVIEGRVKGSITVPSGTLTVARGAKVEAEIRVRSFVLHGELTGTVRAGEKALIAETAEMTGDVITPKITIANGARFSGGIRMKE